MRLTPTLLTAAKGAAVVFALSVLAWLVISAQRSAAPAVDVQPKFLPSSKGMPVRTSADANQPPFLAGSKSFPLIEAGSTQPSVFLPNSKVGQPGVVPTLGKSSKNQD